jgi:site-specific recombinase XerC
MAFLKKFINLMKNELLAKKPKKNRFAWTLSEKKYLKISDINKLKRACKKVRYLALGHDKSVAIRDWFMIEIGLNTGLRVEEMRELKCSDLNIQKGQASVSVRKGKGNKPRNVKISESFRHRCKRFLEWKKRRGQGIEPDSRLLTSNKGTQLSKRALQKAFKKCIKKAGLPEHYSIHALRHTYGTHLYIASNHNLRLVQEQLGHSSVRVTEVYASLVDSDVKRAVERLYGQR